MTAGDKIKLRAELAGKAMAAIIAKVPTRHQMVSPDDDKYIHVARGAIHYADALMKELGLSLEKEDNAIGRRAYQEAGNE